MAGSVNKVILIGNLGADPEIRRTQDGRPIANLRVATSESWRDKTTGERREKTEGHRVVIFNEGLCKIVEQYLKKGAKVYLEGALQTRKWQDKEGHDRYSTEVVLQGFNSQLTMLDRAGGSAGAGGALDSDAGGEFGPGRGPAPPAATTWTTRSRSRGSTYTARLQALTVGALIAAGRTLRSFQGLWGAPVSGISYSEEAAQTLVAIYSTPDVVAQREATLQRLALKIGDRVIDVGCGPGFLCESMAAEVTAAGQVLGVDLSQDLVRFAKKRKSRSWIDYRVGDAVELD